MADQEGSGLTCSIVALPKSHSLIDPSAVSSKFSTCTHTHTHTHTQRVSERDRECEGEIEREERECVSEQERLVG